VGSFAIAEYAASDTEADQVGDDHRTVGRRTSGPIAALVTRLEGEESPILLPWLPDVRVGRA
jgi:hypothetical protein